MSSYADMWKDAKQAEFVAEWCPERDGDGLPPLDEENMRWNIARARSAEAELKQIKDALRALRGAL